MAKDILSVEVEVIRATKDCSVRSFRFQRMAFQAAVKGNYVGSETFSTIASNEHEKSKNIGHLVRFFSEKQR